ncbi:unnamed protein product, partial [Prorocentrum cordatum]
DVLHSSKAGLLALETKVVIQIELANFGYANWSTESGAVAFWSTMLHIIGKCVLWLFSTDTGGVPSKESKSSDLDQTSKIPELTVREIEVRFDRLDGGDWAQQINKGTRGRVEQGAGNAAEWDGLYIVFGCPVSKYFKASHDVILRVSQTPAGTRAIVSPIAVAKRLAHGASCLVDLVVQAQMFQRAVMDLLEWLSCYVAVVGTKGDGPKQTGSSLNWMRALPYPDASDIAHWTFSGLQTSMLTVGSGEKVAKAIDGAPGEVNGRWTTCCASAMPKTMVPEIAGLVKQRGGNAYSLVYERLQLNDQTGPRQAGFGILQAADQVNDFCRRACLKEVGLSHVCKSTFGQRDAIAVKDAVPSRL